MHARPEGGVCAHSCSSVWVSVSRLSGVCVRVRACVRVHVCTCVACGHHTHAHSRVPRTMWMAVVLLPKSAPVNALLGMGASLVLNHATASGVKEVAAVG